MFKPSGEGHTHLVANLSSSLLLVRSLQSGDIKVIKPQEWSDFSYTGTHIVLLSLIRCFRFLTETGPVLSVPTVRSNVGRRNRQLLAEVFLTAQDLQLLAFFVFLSAWPRALAVCNR